MTHTGQAEKLRMLLIRGGLIYSDSEFTCELCHCRVFEGEEAYSVYAKGRFWQLCVLCARAAEIQGWKLE